MTKFKRVILNSGFLYGKTILTVVISIFLSRFVLDGLGISDYGVYNVVGGVIGLMGFVTVTLSNSNTRFLANAIGKNDPDYVVRVFAAIKKLTEKVVLYSVMGLLLAGVVFVNFILNIPQERILAANMVYLCMVANTAYTILTAPYSALLFAREKIGFLSALETAEIISKLGIAYLVTFTTTDNLILYATLLLALSFINRTILKRFCLKNDVATHPTSAQKVIGDAVLRKEILSFSGWTLLESIGIITIRQGSVFLVNIFFGVVVNAAYGIATVVNMQMLQFSSSALNAIKPVIYKSFGTENKARQRFFVFGTSKIGVVLLSLIVVPFICEMDYILSIWLVQIPEFTSIFIKLALVLTIIRQWSYGLIIGMRAHGRIKETQMAAFFLQILNFPVSYFLFTKGYPAYSIFLVAIIIELLILASRLYYADRYIKINALSYLKQIVIKPGIVLVGTYFLFDYWSGQTQPSILRMTVLLFSNLIIVGIYIYTIVLDKHERGLINGLLSSYAKKRNSDEKLPHSLRTQP